jgi:hypothetical protein
MDPRVAPFARLTALNSSLLLNRVAGFTEGEGQRRHPAMSYARRDSRTGSP